MTTASRLRHLLRYDPKTGIFTRLVHVCNRVKVGDAAGTLTKGGYISISVDNEDYQAHRLAWLYIHDSWPDQQLDHINGDKADNRISNLRLATLSQNRHNCGVYKTNSSGFKGVDLHRASGKWRARVMVNGESHHLGLFDTAEQAHAAYCTAASKLHGAYARFA